MCGTGTICLRCTASYIPDRSNNRTKHCNPLDVYPPLFFNVPVQVTSLLTHLSLSLSLCLIFSSLPSDPPSHSKFLVTFPYPYSNGLLHNGHAFPLSEAKFVVWFKPMNEFSSLSLSESYCAGKPVQRAPTSSHQNCCNVETFHALMWMMGKQQQ